MKIILHLIVLCFLPLVAYAFDSDGTINFNMLNRDLLVCANDDDIRSYCKPNPDIIAGIFSSEMKFKAKYSFPCESGPPISFAFAAEKKVGNTVETSFYPVFYDAKQTEISLEGYKLNLIDLNTRASTGARLYNCQLIINNVSVNLSDKTKQILDNDLNFINILSNISLETKSIKEETLIINALISEINIERIPTVLMILRQKVEDLIAGSENLDDDSIEILNDIIQHIDIEILMHPTSDPVVLAKLIEDIKNTLSDLSKISDKLIQIVHNQIEDIYEKAMESVYSIQHLNPESFETYKSKFAKFGISHAL